MEAVQNNDKFSLMFKGQNIFNHSSNKPFITVGSGNACYKMNKGTFNIKDKVSVKLPLPKLYTENLKDSCLLKFRSNDLKYGIDILLKEKGNNLKLNFQNKIGNINRMWINFESEKNEHIYGCGEWYTHFDMKGEKVSIWVSEHQNVKKIALKEIRSKLLNKKADSMMSFKNYTSYYVQPTFISSKKYFFHVDSNAYIDFDFRNDTNTEMFIRDVPNSITIGKGENFEELLTSLTSIIGRQDELPDWVYNGVILGLQGGTDTIKNKLNNALEKGLEVSALWCQDWQGNRITSFGKQLMWNWKWNENLYPNLDKEIKSLHDKGIKFLGYINPFLAVEGDLYKEASKLNYTVKDKDGNDYMVKITTFPAAMVDLTNEDAYKWLKEIIKTNMIGFGLDGWMADFGEYLPCDAVLKNGVKAEDMHNIWPVIWAKLNHEALLETHKEKDIVFFTRAGYTGTAKYSPLMWTGDQYVDWSVDDGLPTVIVASLSLGMSGFGLSHSDIGGYTSLFKIIRTKELFMRWAELAAFTPLMRSHEGNRPDTNAQFDFDDECLNHFARMSKVYKMLSPYIKNAVKENSLSGIPVMRPLFMHYDKDEKTYGIKYEYLLGRDMLVAPVYKEKATKNSVYLPKDNWIHLWTGNEYSGGEEEIDAPYGYPPVFYLKNSHYAQIFEELRFLK